MALDQSALLELLDVTRTADGGELMCRLLGSMLQALVDAEATAFIGAEPHERSDSRTTHALLDPRRRIDVALHAVVMQA